MDHQTYDILQQIVQDEDKFIPLIIAGAITFGILISTIGKTIRGLSRERTRREIAAYVAEGGMSPEHGERILRAKAS